MIMRNAMMNRVLVVSPWLTIILLLGMSYALPNRSASNPDAQQRKAVVAQAMQSVPMFIGRWVGQDKEVPKEAQKLLRPNAILSRIYTSADGPATWIVLVHCSDARDMIGHYPPICYPSAGWREERVSDTDCYLTASGFELPVRQYCFSRIGEHGRHETIRVFNAFILPDGTVTRQIEDINRQSERMAVAVEGVAQVQVITSASIPMTQAIDAANEILGGMSAMLEALKVGQGVSRET